eukprot:GGOE01042644.1.p1 GENE.GGOE01042644.1~~GGOE01042644.1.p1  ORF type:complete len:365 (-),score=53.36 GGOE01042644.1:70-1164(-)
MGSIRFLTPPPPSSASLPQSYRAQLRTPANFPSDSVTCCEMSPTVSTRLGERPVSSSDVSKPSPTLRDATPVHPTSVRSRSAPPVSYAGETIYYSPPEDLDMGTLCLDQQQPSYWPESLGTDFGRMQRQGSMFDVCLEAETTPLDFVSPSASAPQFLSARLGAPTVPCHPSAWTVPSASPVVGSVFGFSAVDGVVDSPTSLSHVVTEFLSPLVQCASLPNRPPLTVHDIPIALPPAMGPAAPMVVLDPPWTQASWKTVPAVHPGMPGSGPFNAAVTSNPYVIASQWYCEPPVPDPAAIFMEVPIARDIPAAPTLPFSPAIPLPATQHNSAFLTSSLLRSGLPSMLDVSVGGVRLPTAPPVTQLV